MRLLRDLFIGILFCLLAQTAVAQCNGHLSLCNKTFNEVAFAYTHNSFNFVGPNFTTAPNQFNPISQQLNDGIRGLMLDVYEHQGEIVLLHSTSLFGTQPLSEVLNDIKSFLDTNPNEVMSIIFQSDITSSQLESELNNAGLIQLMHEQNINDPWPSLQQMINVNRRLVVFSESDNGLPGQNWHHYAWDYIFDTPYSHSAQSDFSCQVNRGQSSNGLYLVNHWITTAGGVGFPDSAVVINQYGVLYPRVEECINTHGRIANFIGLDFYNHGNLFSVVDDLNNVSGTVSLSDLDQIQFVLSPNPASGLVSLSIPFPIENCQLLSSQGQVIKNHSGSKSLDLSPLPCGLYFVKVKANGQTFIKKLIKS